MNKLQKDIVFYSNYCLHCNNLLNKISKTTLHSKILYVCIDDKNIKIPRIITRVPSLYIVGEKRVLIENEIDNWVSNQVSAIESRRKQSQLQQPISNQNMPMDSHPSQNGPLPTINATPQIPDRQMPEIQTSDRKMPESNNNVSNQPAPEGDILAYHGNEMGSTLSNNYSFLEENENSSLNHNFTFIGDNSVQPINTPKEFNDNNQVKSELDQQYEKLMESRNADPTSKGIQRI